MKIQNAYKLYFRWKRIRYEKDTAFFTGAYFTGPVLVKAAEIQPQDHIDLDFTVQNKNTGLFLPKHFYIARLSWKDVTYKDDRVELKKCTLNHNKAGSLKDLENSFSFVIDCSRHDELMHRKILVYPAWVMREDELIT
jgi:hypothetical protein